MKTTTRYTVVTEKSRLGRWLTSRKSAERIATIWAAGINAPTFVKVLDEKGNVVFSAAA